MFIHSVQATGLWLTQNLTWDLSVEASTRNRPEMDFHVDITLVEGDVQLYDAGLNAVEPDAVSTRGMRVLMTDNALICEEL